MLCVVSVWWMWWVSVGVGMVAVVSVIFLFTVLGVDVFAVLKWAC